MSGGGGGRLKSPASRLFIQLFIQAQIKGKHQSSASLAFDREFTGDRSKASDRWIPRTKVQ